MKGRFGQGVSKEFWVGLQNALVDQVYDGTTLLGLISELLRQNEGRAQIRIHVKIISRAGKVLCAVVFKNRRIINEGRNWTACDVLRSFNQSIAFLGYRQVSLNSKSLSA